MVLVDPYTRASFLEVIARCADRIKEAGMSLENISSVGH
jgi:hypothetical protein